MTLKMSPLLEMAPSMLTVLQSICPGVNPIGEGRFAVKRTYLKGESWDCITYEGIAGNWTVEPIRCGGRCVVESLSAALHKMNELAPPQSESLGTKCQQLAVSHQTAEFEFFGGELDYQISEDFDFDRSEVNLRSGKIRNLCIGRGIATFQNNGSKEFVVRVNGDELRLQGSRKRNTLTRRSLKLLLRKANLRLS